MKKLISLFVAIILLVFLGWYAYNLQQSNGISNTELIAFNIEEIESVDKFIISDSYGQKITVVKNDSVWTTESGECLQQQNVKFILDAFKNIEFKGYLPENSRKQHVKMMSAANTKVEIFQNGEWSKTWYLGLASKDHYGQIMLLDSDEYGKSDLPVIMKIKGVNGIIEPRFFADYRKWMCTEIFKLPISEISKVEVKFIQEPSRSFSVLKEGSKMDVFQEDQLLSGVDTSMIFAYLNNYRKIHYEQPNYILNAKQVDSVKHSTPFVELTLTKTNKEQTKLRMFRNTTEELNRNIFGVNKNYNTDNFWCELPNGQLVKCQYFALHPILLGHVYFPMNLDKIVKGEGIE